MRSCVLDPGIETHDGHPSSNLGDLIIQDAVTREVRSLFGSGDILRYSTQQALNRAQLQDIASCSHVFVGGTNLLTSNMLDPQFRNPPRAPLIYRQWKLSPFDTRYLDNAILLGVGWWQYQRPPGMLTKWLLSSVLSDTMMHSVRDSYTATMLQGAGFKNVINTGCPTMWPLAELNQSEIPTTKAENALVMLTDYNKQQAADKALIELLLRRYRKVYLWPQGRADATYIAELGAAVTMLDHKFSGFVEFVSSDIDFDYVGTRLHGGVWCLLHKRRSLILEIDNRAKEIAKDTGLPTVKRTDLEAINRWIEGCAPTRIRMPVDQIRMWKDQFQNSTVSACQTS